MNTPASLARKRAEEQLFHERKQFLKSEANATFVAEWENVTEKKIVKNKITKISKDLEAREHLNLVRRQNNMKELYEKEQLIWKEKIDELNEVTPEDRMQAIKARASELKNKREKEKDDFCMKMLEKQKIEGSEELRALNRSKDDQISASSSEIKSNKFHTYAHVTNPEHSETERQYSDIEQVKKRNMDLKLALDEQIRMNREKKESEYQQKRLEEKMQLDNWNREALLEQSALLEHKKNIKMKMSEDFTRTMQNLKSSKERAEIERRRQDAYFQQNFLCDTMAPDPKEKENYIESLKYQISEKNTSSYNIEAIRDAYQEKISDEREAELRGRSEARKKVNLEVALEQKKQAYEKMILKDREKEEMAKYIQSELDRLQLLEIAQKEEAAKKKNATISNAQYNLAEIERKNLQRRLEKEKSLSSSREAGKRWQLV